MLQRGTRNRKQEIDGEGFRLDFTKLHQHINDIFPRNFVEVCLDHRMMGVAGDDAWGSQPYPKYKLPTNKDYHWNFTILPIKNNMEISEKLSYQYLP